MIFIFSISSLPCIQKSFPPVVRVLDKSFIKGKGLSQEEEDIVQEILRYIRGVSGGKSLQNSCSRSDTYDKLFHEFLNATGNNFLPSAGKNNLIVTNTDLYIWHDVQVLVYT